MLIQCNYIIFVHMCNVIILKILYYSMVHVKLQKNWPNMFHCSFKQERRWAGANARLIHLKVKVSWLFYLSKEMHCKWVWMCGHNVRIIIKMYCVCAKTKNCRYKCKTISMNTKAYNIVIHIVHHVFFKYTPFVLRTRICIIIYFLC